MEKTVIRPARDDDLETIKQIAVTAWETVYQSFQELTGDEIFQAVYGNWRVDKAGQVERHYKAYPECTLVTEHDGQIVGFITYNLFHSKKLGIIGNNAIHPKHQNKGLGTEQYMKVLDIFRKSGMLYAGVTTGSDESHASARTAYEKVGFEPTIRTVRYYRKL